MLKNADTNSQWYIFYYFIGDNGMDWTMLAAKDLMQTELISVTKETSIVDVVDILGKKKLTGLPVVDDEGNLVGIITEKDVLRIAYQIISDTYDLSNCKTVGDLMITDIVTFDTEDNLADICQCFMNRPIRRVPVVENGKLVGVVSRRDIIFKAFTCHNESKQTV